MARLVCKSRFFVPTLFKENLSWSSVGYNSSELTKKVEGLIAAKRHKSQAACSPAACSPAACYPGVCSRVGQHRSSDLGPQGLMNDYQYPLEVF